MLDYTRTAATITPGDIVNDDQSYTRIRVDQVLRQRENTVIFTGTRLNGPKDEVIRFWPADARVTVYTHIEEG